MPSLSEHTKDKSRRIVGPKLPPGGSKARMEGGALYPLKSLQAKMEWTNDAFPAEVIKRMRQIADLHEEVDQLIKIWDRLPKHRHIRFTAIDAIMKEIGMTNSEFFEFAMEAFRVCVQREAAILQWEAMPELVKASLEAAKGKSPSSMGERTKHLTALGVIKNKMVVKDAKKAKGSIVSEDGELTPAMTLDEQLAELDAIESENER